MRLAATFFCPPHTIETLVSLFNQAVATQPNSTATWFMGKTLTYGQLNEQVGRAAAALSELGANARAFHDGWIRLVARIKEMIITGGFNVYPDEVEAILRSHPDIEDVAVVGRPRADGSEDVVACVTLTDGSALDPNGLKAYARERLTRYKVPRDFYHFEQLQRDQTGKIRRREVRDTLLALLT